MAAGMSDDWPPKPPPDPGEPGPIARDRDAGALPPRPTGHVEADDAPASPPDRRALGLAIVAVLGFIIVAALVGGTKPPGAATFPPAGATTGPAGGVAATTRGDVIRALAGQGLQAEDTSRPYRPAEAPAFAAAPRILVRAILPDDPDHGLIVIYEFSSPAAATAAAEEEATYIASGIGRVQFPNDAQFVIRVVGSTAVFFTWSPPSSPDERTAAIATALETLGSGVEVPN
jgi:hypothetical protein